MSFSLDTENSHKLTFGEIQRLTNDIKPYGFRQVRQVSHNFVLNIDFHDVSLQFDKSDDARKMKVLVLPLRSKYLVTLNTYFLHLFSNTVS